jgi:hypothetical protein
VHFSRLPSGSATASIVLGVLACCLVVPALAFGAAAGAAPPGNAAVQEFVESLPDGTGLRTSNSIAEFRSQALATGRVVDRRTRRRLLAGWPDGGSIVSLAEATGPQPPPGSRKPEPAPAAESPVRAAVEHIARGSGPDGMGVGLPLVLLASAAVAVGYALVRGVQGPGSSR